MKTPHLTLHLAGIILAFSVGMSGAGCSALLDTDSLRGNGKDSGRKDAMLDGTPDDAGHDLVADRSLDSPTGTDGKPKDAKPIDARPKDAKPIDARPKDAKPIDARPKDAKPIDARPKDAKPIDARPIDARPIDARPIDARPIDAKPIDAKVPDAMPLDSATPDV